MVKQCFVLEYEMIQGFSVIFRRVINEHNVEEFGSFTSVLTNIQTDVVLLHLVCII